MDIEKMIFCNLVSQMSSLQNKIDRLAAAYSASALTPTQTAAAHTHLDALLALFAESNSVPLKPAQQVEALKPKHDSKSVSSPSLFIAPMDLSFPDEMVSQIVSSLPKWNCTILKSDAVPQAPGVVVVLHNCTGRRYESENIDDVRTRFPNRQICHFFIINKCRYVDYQSPQPGETTVYGSYVTEDWIVPKFTEAPANGLASLTRMLDLYITNDPRVALSPRTTPVKYASPAVVASPVPPVKYAGPTAVKPATPTASACGPHEVSIYSECGMPKKSEVLFQEKLAGWECKFYTEAKEVRLGNVIIVHPIVGYPEITQREHEEYVKLFPNSRIMVFYVKVDPIRIQVPTLPGITYIPGEFIAENLQMNVFATGMNLLLEALNK